MVNKSVSVCGGCCEEEDKKDSEGKKFVPVFLK
jgi:hypothetical protein